MSSDPNRFALLAEGSPPLSFCLVVCIRITIIALSANYLPLPSVCNYPQMHLGTRNRGEGGTRVNVCVKLIAPAIQTSSSPSQLRSAAVVFG